MTWSMVVSQNGGGEALHNKDCNTLELLLGLPILVKLPYCLEFGVPESRRNIIVGLWRIWAWGSSYVAHGFSSYVAHSFSLQITLAQTVASQLKQEVRVCFSG